MQKQGQRFRDIRFFSAKNKSALSAHTKAELLYAGKLERDKRVLDLPTFSASKGALFFTPKRADPCQTGHIGQKCAAETIIL